MSEQVKAPKPSEKEIQRSIMEYLTLRGVFHFRNNTGAMASSYNGKNRFIRFGAVGSGDIFAIRRGDGRFVSIEVKAPGKKPTPAQLAFMDKIRENGGIAFVAYSVDDVEAFL